MILNKEKYHGIIYLSHEHSSYFSLEEVGLKKISILLKYSSGLEFYLAGLLSFAGVKSLLFGMQMSQLETDDKMCHCIAASVLTGKA